MNYNLQTISGDEPLSPDKINGNTNVIDTELKKAETHRTNTSNPHKVTKAQVGLGSVDNTADSAKNVATAVKATKDGSGNTITSTYATKSELTTHTDNTTSHITAAERTAWNKNITDISSLNTDLTNVENSVAVNVFDGVLVVGEYDTSGNANSTAGRYRNKNRMSVESATPYIFSINNAVKNYSCFFYDTNGTFISNIGTTNGIVTTPTNAKYMNFRCFVADYTSDYANLKVMIEKGTEVHTYQPYIGADSIPKAISALNENLTELSPKVDDTLSMSMDNAYNTSSYLLQNGRRLVAGETWTFTSPNNSVISKVAVSVANRMADTTSKYTVKVGTYEIESYGDYYYSNLAQYNSKSVTITVNVSSDIDLDNVKRIIAVKIWGEKETDYAVYGFNENDLINKDIFGMKNDIDDIRTNLSSAIEATLPGMPGNVMKIEDIPSGYTVDNLILCENFVNYNGMHIWNSPEITLGVKSDGIYASVTNYLSSSIAIFYRKAV